jgi:predicted GIY-YIG superfamily endonuclease
MVIAPGQTGFVFSQAGINASAPQKSGVYAIYNSNRWIYIGETNDLRRRLTEHLNEGGSCIKKHNPTDFIFEEFPEAFRVARQNALIAQYYPACNQMFG